MDMTTFPGKIETVWKGYKIDISECHRGSVSFQVFSERTKKRVQEGFTTKRTKEQVLELIKNLINSDLLENRKVQRGKN